MSPAAAWRWCLAAGLAAFACAWGFGRIPGLVACGPTGGRGPIIAFELARSPAAAAAIFGAEPCRSALIPAQRFGLLLDAAGFIPAYTAFLCLAAWAARREFARPVIAALSIAGLMDEVEGGLLFLILRDFPGGQPVFDILFWVVRAKFLLLGLGTLAIAVLLLVRWPVFRLTELSVLRFVGGLGIGYGSVAALRGFFEGPAPFMTTAFAMAWFTLLLVALVGAVWPLRLAPGRQLRPPARPSA